MRNASRSRRRIAPTTVLGLIVIAVALPLAASRTWADDTSGIDLQGSIAPGGIGAFAEGHWALVRGVVKNATDTDQEVRVVFSFDSESGRQFVRRTWVPAQSRRIVEWPARLASIDPQAKAAAGRAMLLAADAETSYDEVPGTAIVMREELLTTVVSSGDSASDVAITGVLAAREQVGLGRRMSFSGALERSGPRYTLGWEPAKVVVLAVAEMDLDAARRQALRRWVRAGGVLWVMADRIDYDDMAESLGEDWSVTLVDRVTLNEVDTVAQGETDRRSGGSPLSDEPVITEDPILMARVIAPDYKTLLTVRGWPALLERSVGAGRIVVTTLNARGWSDPVNERALALVAETVFHRQTTPKGAEPDAAGAFIESQIGYEVAGRPTVALVLGGYVGAVLVLGLVLLARGRGEWIAPCGIGAALVATVVLGAIGLASRGKVDATIATFQSVQVEPESSVAMVTGSIGLFAPFEREATLASQRGGWAWPTAPAAGGSNRRLMWTDLDYWTWERLPLSGGKAERLDISTTAEFAEPAEVALQFGEAGIVGSINTGSGVALSDLVLINGPVATAVERTGGAESITRIAIRPDGVLPAGTFLASDLLTQTQQRRGDMLKAFVASRPLGAEPVLVAWSDLIDDGLNGDADMPRRGSAMWQLPVVIQPAAPGTRVTVPWPMVEMQPVRNINGRSTGGLVYADRTGEWLATALPGTFNGRFVLPDAVTPLKIDGASLVLDISAINRPVTIKLLNGATTIDLVTLNGPDGEQRVELPVDRFGRATDAVTLSIVVGDLADPSQGLDSQSSMWQIRRLGLEVRGVTAERGK